MARICQGCGSELTGDVRFCPKCGRALERQVCQGCGAPLIEGARFCRICGKEVTSLTSHPPPPKQSDIARHQKKVKVITSSVAAVAAVGAAIYLLFSLSPFFGGGGTPNGSYPSDGSLELASSPPVTVQYVDRDGQQRSAYSHTGRITIIAEKGTTPEAIHALVKSAGAAIYVQIANCDLYYAKGFDGRESNSVSSLLQNPIVADAFPTPICSAKGLYIIEDYSTVITRNGEYLHHNTDGTFSWREKAAGALTHGKLVELLSGASGKNNIIDCAVPSTDKDGNPMYEMDIASALEKADNRAREDRERGETTILNNSWGASLDVPKGASADDHRQAVDSFVTNERNNYTELFKFLEGNPNAIAVKCAGNEGLDISGLLVDAKKEAGDKWNRLVIVGALDSSLNPAGYSNRAVGLTDILWVPELTTKDGGPVIGTSFTTPRISQLLDRIARERPDLTPEQIASILFDERVSPRVNLRPTIVDPLSNDAFINAIEVATKLFSPKSFVRPLTPARDLTGTWKNPLSGQGFVVTKIWEGSEQVQYHDVEWKVKQSGNTIAGYMTVTYVKGYLSGNERWIVWSPARRDPKLPTSQTVYLTGTVEGTKITINMDIDGLTLTGSFTTDFMTLTGYLPEKRTGGGGETAVPDPFRGGVVVIPEPEITFPEMHYKLSLSRVR